MISFRMKAEEENFLKQYANENSLNLSMFIKKAVFQAIEDKEDYTIAEKISKDIKAGKEQTKSWNDFKLEMSSDV